MSFEFLPGDSFEERMRFYLVDGFSSESFGKVDGEKGFNQIFGFGRYTSLVTSCRRPFYCHVPDISVYLIDSHGAKGANSNEGLINNDAKTPPVN